MKKLIEELTTTFMTRNPFEIAACLGIEIIYAPLGEVNGFYNTALGEKYIHVNQDLSENGTIFTIAHELGHALLHHNLNSAHLKQNTFFSTNKYEVEANKFAINLLISDEDLKQMKHFTVSQISNIYGFHEKLIRLRLE